MLVTWIRYFIIIFTSSLFFTKQINAQQLKSEWIRPHSEHDPAVWGLKNGIVFGLWPYGIETSAEKIGGGPRGLIRIGYAFNDFIYHINYLAVEPIVNNKMEFSEISPSQVDGQWGKLMWASDTETPGKFSPFAVSTGVISHPDSSNADIEELSLFVFMEKYLNGAHPYLKISIRNDRPEELAIEIFSQDDGAIMEQCGLTATMGNYSRLRLLHLKDKIVDSRKLYNGFSGIDFIEKESYAADQMLENKNGLMVIAEPNESFSTLSSWPQEDAYYKRRSWRYRPFFKVIQYWRKEGLKYDPSLRVRVNGRAKYWTGGTNDKSKYIDIPGGPAFENFELREKYYSGQKFYFGITRKKSEELLQDFKK